ncbi:MAG TPA: cytochrome c [Tepidisphaeraceae bacterium]|jgi:mono/diheme cytochrome c family protein|nr:cytochrome c [Tepidisphaeraceae bacterium]
MAHDEHDESADPNLPPTRPVREPKLRPPPFWMVAALVIGLVATWLPLAFFAKARAATSDEPRVQLIQDMGKQPKFREQMADEVFADGRADRMRIDGTVARGELHTDDHYWLGYHMEVDPKTGTKTVTFYDTFPDEVKVTDALLARGKQRFEIYCSPCHGLDGSGNGLVNLRAHELKESAWVSPVNLHDATYRGRAVGDIYNTINVGIRNMPPYGAQIPAADRWAIVSYVRALQLSENAPASVLTPQQQQDMK